MLEGKAIIELTDVNTGEKTVIEEKNLVTNAFAEFFNSPMSYLGIYALRNTSYSYTPFATNPDVRWATAGLMVLDESDRDEDANNYKYSLGNVIGLAAKQYKCQNGDNRYGEYNEAESVIDREHGTFTHVFDFPTSACNGTVRSLSLMHPGAVVGFPMAKYDTFKNNLDEIYRRGIFLGTHISSEAAYSLVNPNPGHSPNYASATCDGQYVGTPMLIGGDDWFKNPHTDAHLDWLQHHEMLIALDYENDCVYTIVWTEATKFRLRARQASFKSISLIAPFKLIWETDEINVTNLDANSSNSENFIVDKQTKKAYFVTNSANAGYTTVTTSQSFKLYEIDLVEHTTRVFDLVNATGETITIEMGFGSRTGTSGDSNDNFYYLQPKVAIHNGYMYVNPNRTVTTANAERDYVIYKIPLNNATAVEQCKVVSEFTSYLGGTMPRCMSLWNDNYIRLDDCNNWSDYSHPVCVLDIGSNTIYQEFAKGKYLTSDYGAFRISYYWSDSNNLGTATFTGHYPVLGSQYVYSTFHRTYNGGGNSSYRNNGYFEMRMDLPLTINNLSTPIHKTPSQTMKVTYVIRDPDMSST